MTAYTKHIDLVFAGKADKNDFDLIEPASYDTPGRVRLAQARQGDPLPNAPTVRRIYSHNGGGFIGYLADDDEPLAPYQETYWLEENSQGAASVPQ